MNKSQEILLYLKIKKLGFTPDEYFYLRLLQCGKENLMDEGEAAVIKQSIFDKGIEDFDKVFYQLDLEQLDVDKFVENYRNLFPKMMLPSGKTARSTSAEVKTKMKWFLANHNFTEDQILKATEAYVNEREMEEYMYMQTASYFIYKDDRNKVRSSALAERCELLEENIETKNFGIDA